MIYDILIENLIEQAFVEINALTQKGSLSHALELCEGLYGRFPDHARVLHSLGVLCFRNGECQRGIELVNKAIEVKPDYADAYYNLSQMMKFFWRLDEEERLLKRSLECNPNHSNALVCYAVCLKNNGKWQEATVCCDKSLSIHFDNPIALETLGNINLHTGNVADAVAYYRKALAAGASSATQSNIIHYLHLLPTTSQKEIYEESLQWERLFGFDKLPRLHLNSSDQNRKIRIGYVSGDLKFHPVCYHLKPVLAAHDMKNVEIYLYSTISFQDDMTRELAGYASQYRDISMLSDERAEAVIRGDGIDILVDLSGHTAFNRLTLFERKPAPVQMSWIGYFNTTGLKTIDYLVSDPISIPPEDDALIVEKVLRLPDIRFCYAPPHATPDVAVAPVLKNGYITFGSFNKICKINEEVVHAWSKVLHAVSRSRLLLKWALLDDGEVRDRYIGAFADQGIERERLILRPESSYMEMLNEYGDIDIALDTFPFNGGATTCDALWMGVPVITLEGKVPISRQSKAFLYALGRPEWVACSTDEFVQIAVHLAKDSALLSKIRESQRESMIASPLCDGLRFTRNLEHAYRMVWSEWCAKRNHASLNSKELMNFDANELFNAGVDAMSFDDYLWAALLFQMVLKKTPVNADAGNNLGVCFFKLHRIPEAIKAFKRTIRINPSFGKAYSNLAKVYLEIKQEKKALELCRHTVELLPDQPDVMIDLGYAYSKINGSMHLAIKTFEHVLESDVDNIQAMLPMANLLAARGDVPDALALLRKALIIEPENIRAFSILLFLMQYIPNTTQENLYNASRYAGRLIEGASHDVFNPLSPMNREKEHLRIGFVSSDFRKHPVGALLVGLFRYSNTEKLSLYCYHNLRTGDSVTDWYNATSSGMRNIFDVSDTDVARLIREDQIDILVDLSGHTDGHRLSLFALRPAPVQATWIGYCHTTGMKCMDYIIAGTDFISSDDERWFTETVVHLSGNRFCFSPPEQSPDVLPAPFLENGYITFGCFNNLAKITSDMIQVWAQLLNLVPRSRLVLKSKDFANIEVRKLFRDKFEQCGISSKRLQFRSQSGYYLMLMEYCDIDISLDPFPFTGGMTTLESLWMGVPVITMAGELPISRQSKSFLDCVELQDLVTYTPEQYISCAVRLAADSERLSEMRRTLRDRLLTSSLCDAKSYSSAVEALFFQIWRQKSEKSAKLTQITGDRLLDDGEDTSSALINIRMHLQNGRLETAKELALKLLHITPENDAALVLLGVVCVNQGLLEKGIKCFRQALLLNSTNHNARSKLVFALNYTSRYSQKYIYKESLKWRYNESQLENRQNVFDKTYFFWPSEEKIRIGFISRDFKRHSVSMFFEPLIASLDSNIFETYCYSDVETPDDTTVRLKGYAHSWTDSISLTDEQLAFKVMRDRIGILVDLGGHTGTITRLPVFALKPAPVQVSWLGYPNTTGLATIDYRITDDITDPPGVDRWYSERLVRLSDGFLCYQPPQSSPAIARSPVLSKGYITFGSFNMLPKISRECIEMWSAIVNSVPNARLLLKCHSFHDSATRTRILSLFSKAGLDMSKIDVRPTVLSSADHLEMYNEVDVALDSYPYNGTTTTCEALWMGVPVVTLSGERHVSRVGMSILSRIGCQELITETPDEYCACAVNWATDYKKMADFREHARQFLEKTPLMDRKLFTISMEKAFLSFWHDYIHSQRS